MLAVACEESLAVTELTVMPAPKLAVVQLGEHPAAVLKLRELPGEVDVPGPALNLAGRNDRQQLRLGLGDSEDIDSRGNFAQCRRRDRLLARRRGVIHGDVHGDRSRRVHRGCAVDQHIREGESA